MVNQGKRLTVFLQQILCKKNWNNGLLHYWIIGLIVNSWFTTHISIFHYSNNESTPKSTKSIMRLRWSRGFWFITHLQLFDP